MTINGENLASLASKLNTTFSNLQSDGTSAIKEYANAQNEIWRSSKSIKLATEIKECLDSAIKNIGIKQNNIRSAIQTNVRNHNATEGTSLSFTYDYVAADTSGLGNVSESWGGNETGLKEGHTISELKPYFDSITAKFNNCFSEMLSAVNGSQVFSPTQQSELSTAITTVKNNFATEVDELSKSWSSRAQGEDTVREKEASTASSNFAGLS